MIPRSFSCDTQRSWPLINNTGQWIYACRFLVGSCRVCHLNQQNSVRIGFGSVQISAFWKEEWFSFIAKERWREKMHFWGSYDCSKWQDLYMGFFGIFIIPLYIPYISWSAKRKFLGLIKNGASDKIKWVKWVMWLLILGKLPMNNMCKLYGSSYYIKGRGGFEFYFFPIIFIIFF